MKPTDKQLGMMTWMLNKTGLKDLLPEHIVEINGQLVNHTMFQFEKRAYMKMDKEEASILIGFLVQYDDFENKNSKEAVKDIIKKLYKGK